MGLTEDLSRIFVKAKRGQPISPAERATLQQALLGLAPASKEYKEVSAMLSQGSNMAADPMGGDPASLPNPGADSGTLGNIADMLPRFAEGGAFSGGLDPRGSPTRDWMNPGPLGELARSRVNAASDIPGSPPPGPGGLDPRKPNAAEAAEAGVSENTRLPSRARGPIGTDFSPGGAGPIAGGAAALNNLGGYNEEEAIDPFLDMPGGYSFSDSSAGSIGLLARNPSAYLTQYAEEKGGGANMAAFMADPFQSALAMSRAGLLGGGYGDDINAGATMGDTRTLANVEDFLNQYSKQGQFVDPKAIMAEMMTRAAGTNYEGMKHPETNLPMTPEQIIDTTNQALMASAAFMGPEGASWLNSILLSKGDEYINKLATGEIDANTSYPAWLQQQGIGDIL